MESNAHRIEPYWDAQLASATVIALDASLPGQLLLDARWLAPALSGVLLLVLMVATPWNATEAIPRSAWQRRLALVMLTLVAVTHLGSLAALVVDIVDHRGLAGGTLLRAAAQLWAATVLIFAVLYWELDRNGPIARSHNGPPPNPLPERYADAPDFFFAQMDDSAPVRRPWMPAFADYLYLAATNSTAFSPTDTLPLTVRAKMLMLVQSTTSFVLVALVAARAVNVLQ